MTSTLILAGKGTGGNFLAHLISKSRENDTPALYHSLNDFLNASDTGLVDDIVFLDTISTGRTEYIKKLWFVKRRLGDSLNGELEKSKEAFENFIIFMRENHPLIFPTSIVATDYFTNHNESEWSKDSFLKYSLELWHREQQAGKNDDFNRSGCLKQKIVSQRHAIQNNINFHVLDYDDFYFNGIEPEYEPLQGHRKEIREYNLRNQRLLKEFSQYLR